MSEVQELDEVGEYEPHYLVGKREITRVFNVTVNTVTNWKVNPVDKDCNGFNIYYLPHVCRYIRQREDKKGDLVLEQERARLAIEQTEKTKLEQQKLELEVGVRRKELVEIEDVLLDVTNIFSIIRTKLLAIPNKIGLQVYNADTPQDGEDVLKKEIAEIIDEIRNTAYFKKSTEKSSK